MTEMVFEEREMWIMTAHPHNSMTYWYEKLKEIPNLTIPKSFQIPLNRKYIYSSLMEHNVTEKVKLYCSEIIPKLIKTVEEIFKFPVFMRTSEMSVKHSWNETCFVESKDKMIHNFWTLIEDNYLATDHIPDAIYLREFIPMESYFTGWYHEFPINKEVRTFFKEGMSMCNHPYWPKEVMKQAKPKDPDWETKFEQLSNLTGKDWTEIDRMLTLVKEKFTESHGWSCDFAKSKDGIWYLIDMAMYPVSYHYPGCKNIPVVRGKDDKIRKEES